MTGTSSGISHFLATARSGFSRSFWVANTLELFERFAYYGSKAILVVFVADQVGLGPETAGVLAGSLFNTLLYFLPLLAGTVVGLPVVQAVVINLTKAARADLPFASVGSPVPTPR